MRRESVRTFFSSRTWTKHNYKSCEVVVYEARTSRRIDVPILKRLSEERVRQDYADSRLAGRIVIRVRNQVNIWRHWVHWLCQAGPAKFSPQSSRSRDHAKASIMRKLNGPSTPSLQLMIALFCATSIASGAERPNILFLIADDLSANALGCYGNRQCQTPHIDKLAERGFRFDRAYCQYPVCGASRAAIMSGQYAQVIGVTGNGNAQQFTELLGNRPSMSQLFRHHDYFAARIGKIYHMRVPGDITANVSGPDHAASWDEAINCGGPEWMSDGFHSHHSNEELNRDPNRHYGLGFGGAFYVVKTPGDGRDQPDVKAANEAIRFLETQRDQPFFLAVGFVRPHVPLVAPKAFFEPYPFRSMHLPENPEHDLDDIPRAGRGGSSQARGLDSQARKQKTLAAYYASVQFMDAQVGRILAKLEERQLATNTIVVFTSDHGYHLGEHELWQKMSLHEESVRVPLVLSVPQQSPGVSASLVEQIDIYPTLADLAGLPIPAHCQGKSLRPILNHPNQQIRDAVYCLRRRNDHLYRTKDWALIHYRANDQFELYDLRNDPQQFHNLANDPQFNEQKTSLLRRLNKKLASFTSLEESR